MKRKSKMIDRNDENDLIPSADELREEVIFFEKLINKKEILK